MNAIRGLGRGVLACGLALVAPVVASAIATDDPSAARPALAIPKLDRAPSVADFAEMRPGASLGDAMAKVDGFSQTEPTDGRDASKRTEAYLGYDDANVYVVFLAFDRGHRDTRARRVAREKTDGDDLVTVTLDTYDDRRRAYVFSANPYGIQSDFLEADGAERDATFDTVWDSEGALVDGGYVVVMAIPFKSLRFPTGAEQTWGILLERWIAGAGERDYWPRVSTAVQSRLAQSARLTGIGGVSQGRNMQFIPYASLQSVKAVDARDPKRAVFDRSPARVNAGLDAKFGLGSSLVLDVTLNPDFGQVESDDPKASVNERFELFTPEKRPFFIENSDYFKTPLDLVFTRRIADPSMGVRLTGKIGGTSLGVLAMDDEAPGKLVPDSDPRRDLRAGVVVARVAHDVFDGSKIGGLYTDRELDGGHNRVGALDARFRLDEHWSSDVQAAASSTMRPDGTGERGTAFRAFVSGTGRTLHYEALYKDVSPTFDASLGFVPRRDIRSLTQYGSTRWQPEWGPFVAIGPRAYENVLWDHDGQRVYAEHGGGLYMELKKRTIFNVWYNGYRERLRPSDYAAIDATRSYSYRNFDAYFSTAALRAVTLTGDVYFHATALNFNPAEGKAPEVATRPTETSLTATISPLSPLRIDTTYLLTRLRDRESNAGILVNHILRSKWNWQFSRELSLRAIVQWDALRANAALTSLASTRHVNADVLLAYQVNPWTALYVGYNGNLNNYALVDRPAGARLERVREGWLTDSRQFFVKFTYLIRG